MTAIAIDLCEKLGDQAAELGLRLARANPGTLPAEVIIHLREALSAAGRVDEQGRHAGEMLGAGLDRFDPAPLALPEV